MTEWRNIAVLSPGILAIPRLSQFLGARVVPGGKGEGFDAVVGWGLRPTADKARRLAEASGVPYLALEDGFLRSIEAGKKEPPLSVVLDDIGIYYDATRPSRLEALIAKPLTEGQSRRAKLLIESWRAGMVSKYNYARDLEDGLPGRYVLAVDQTWGDASIRYGMADERSFHRMLQAALDENPDATILLKLHPEVVSGRKKGHFDPNKLSRISRVQVLTHDAHPACLIRCADAVYTVTSQMGFEGLLWNKRVRTFGMPFYAGWGLTQDEVVTPERRWPVGIENLVHAALVKYPRYIDPETGQRCEVERIIEWMAWQRQMRSRFPITVYGLNYSIWKRPIVRSFFQGSHVKFVNNIGQVPSGGAVAVWGCKPAAGQIAADVSLVRLEDGFLRSVGLGADLVRPISWVMDRRGIYYDATRPSDLEHLLATTDFDRDMLARAASLRERIVMAGLTKYNVGAERWQRPAAAERVILVPGQVESDDSIRFGAPEIRTNLALLRAVREANPHAYLLYKPHPDVVAGLRKQGIGESEARQWCDQIVVDCSMADLLDEVDEVHTLTSLAGFEAMLRGKQVVCYGLPFYAGWGLTRDKVAIQRRDRRLKLDELVAGALILYPTYVSLSTGNPTTPERALDELLEWREKEGISIPIWRKLQRMLLRLGAN